MKKVLKGLLLVSIVSLSAPVSAYEQFRASDGTQCRSDRETRAELELSTYATEGYESGVKATVTIKLGEMAKPLNCKRLEDLEIARLKLELEVLRQQLTEQTTWE